MPKKSANQKTAGVSNNAVLKSTGKTWDQWFKLLDKAKAATMNHKQIAARLNERHGEIGSWWVQMVTVAYEQARGLRQKHQKPGGFEISGSKTINVPVSRLYSAWKDARTRRRWLPDHDITIRKANENKSMRITWSDGATSVSLNFYPKGDEKSQVSLQHGKLKNAAEAEAKKAFWKKRLEVLKKTLEE
jgi:hypothetical protein